MVSTSGNEMVSISGSCPFALLSMEAKEYRLAFM